MTRAFIQGVRIDFVSVERMLIAKLSNERNLLSSMTLDDASLSDMATFDSLVNDMHATTRILEVLQGKYDTIYGETVQITPPPRQQTEEDTDIDKLADELAQRRQLEGTAPAPAVPPEEPSEDDKDKRPAANIVKRLFSRNQPNHPDEPDVPPQTPHQETEAEPVDPATIVAPEVVAQDAVEKAFKDNPPKDGKQKA